MSSFVPRSSFAIPNALPRSYFLGHHRAGLNKMKALISNIDLIIECRDYRVPICSYNPLLEQSLEGKRRLIVYTKRDLGTNDTGAERKMEAAVRKWHRPDVVIYSDSRDPKSARKILDYLRQHSASAASLTGTRAIVVGMPNVGKSTLLNVLRQHGVHKGKAAKTGAQPGVTRRIASLVKIVEATEDEESVYLQDTPGVFIPYVPNGESMLKLALCGIVKDTIIPPTIMADYLLYQLNLNGSNLYERFCEPTNNVEDLLIQVARRTGRLQREGRPDLEAAALWLIQRWREGDLGKFLLDNVTRENLRQAQAGGMEFSFNQARKSAKEEQRQRYMSNSLT